MRSFTLLLNAALFCWFGIARGQSCSGSPCSNLIPPASVLVCDPLTHTALSNNAIINSGETFFYDGGTVTFSGVNVNGGTLIVCQGPVTFDGFTFGTGSVIIASGATVNFNNYYNGGTSSHYFYNYGAVNFNIDISIQGTTTHEVYNGPGAVINTSGRMDIVNGGLIVNDGTINVAGEVRIQGSGQACLGNGSQINTIDLWVDNTNPISVPSGVACVGYSNQMQGNGTLTNSSCLRLCQGPGASPPVNPSTVGDALLMTNCIGCSGISLGVELLTFDLEERDKGVQIKWTTGVETTTSRFILERGSTVNAYKQITTLKAVSEGSSNAQNQYSFQDPDPLPDVNYYRLSEVSETGIRRELAVKSIELKQTAQLSVFPEPCQSGEDIQIRYKPKKDRNTFMEIRSITGDLIHREKLKEESCIHPVILSQGYFILYLFENNTLISTKRMIVV